jgi:hypothetical protein
MCKKNEKSLQPNGEKKKIKNARGETKKKKYREEKQNAHTLQGGYQPIYPIKIYFNTFGMLL